MTLETFALIAHVQTAVFALGLLLSFLKFKTRQPYIRLLGFALLVSVSADLLNTWLIYSKYYRIISVNYPASIYNILVFPLISCVYYFTTGSKHKKAFTILSILFVLFASINLLFIQKSTINSYSLFVFSILIILYALYYFYWLLQELPTTHLHTLPMFWINSANIIYYAGNLFLFAFTSYLVKVLNNNLLIYWTLHNILGIIQGLMILAGVWMDLRNIKSQS